MSHCMFIEDGCLVNAGAACTCLCCECQTLQRRGAMQELVRTVEQIVGVKDEFWLQQLEAATLTIEAQTARIVALEGGIVAENARVVREHNELRAALAAATKHARAADLAFARFSHEVAMALGGLSNEGTLDRIRALRAECDSAPPGHADLTEGGSS